MADFSSCLLKDVTTWPIGHHLEAPTCSSKRRVYDLCRTIMGDIREEDTFCSHVRLTSKSSPLLPCPFIHLFMFIAVETAMTSTAG